MRRSLKLIDPETHASEVPKALTFQPVSAKFMAQFISMGPFVFQAARCLKKYGILGIIYKANNEGANFEEIKKGSDLSAYSLGVLLDAGISIKLISFENQKYYLTQVGYFIHFDEITRVNMNFSHDVCYQGLFNLDEALQTNTPAGLKSFGDWKTIYEGLTSLPSTVLESWFDFDHFYSSGAFPRALPIVLSTKPQKIMDVGGNTGKFAITCAQAEPKVHITIVDHPQQIELSKINVQNENLLDRIDFYSGDLLNEDTTLPMGYDIIWMSQFLDCFSEEQIIYLLNKVKKSLNPGGSIMIMETFTDNQKFESAKFCLDMSSLYFTAMANGNSRMYPLAQFKGFIQKAGLRIETIHDGVKLFHTILICKT